MLGVRYIGAQILGGLSFWKATAGFIFVSSSTPSPSERRKHTHTHTHTHPPTPVGGLDAVGLDTIAHNAVIKVCGCFDVVDPFSLYVKGNQKRRNHGTVGDPYLKKHPMDSQPNSDSTTTAWFCL